MAETETTKCPHCDVENEATAKKCASPACDSYLKSELECLRSIDVSVTTIKRIAIWWLILSILFVFVAIIYAISREV